VEVCACGLDGSVPAVAVAVAVCQAAVAPVVGVTAECDGYELVDLG
jgi:hypothetical protein